MYNFLMDTEIFFLNIFFIYQFHHLGICIGFSIFCCYYGHNRLDSCLEGYARFIERFYFNLVIFFIRLSNFQKILKNYSFLVITLSKIALYEKKWVILNRRRILQKKWTVSILAEIDRFFIISHFVF